MPIKVNDKFTFEKEIFLDRFMLEYREQAEEINRKITKLRSQLLVKESSLQKIINYLNTDLDIIKVLGIAGEFLQRQTDGNQINQESDPTAIGQLVNPQEIAAALKTVQTYRQNLESQRDQLKDAIVKSQVSIILLGLIVAIIMLKQSSNIFFYLLYNI